MPFGVCSTSHFLSQIPTSEKKHWKVCNNSPGWKVTDILPPWLLVTRSPQIGVQSFSTQVSGCPLSMRPTLDGRQGAEAFPDFSKLRSPSDYHRVSSSTIYRKRFFFFTRPDHLPQLKKMQDDLDILHNRQNKIYV